MQNPLVGWGRDGIWAVDSQENHLKCCHQMSDLKAKMHQNRFRLGLCPRPRWGSLQRSPRFLAEFKECLLLRGGRGRKGEGKGEEGKEREGREREDRERKERGREGLAMVPNH